MRLARTEDIVSLAASRGGAVELWAEGLGAHVRVPMDSVGLVVGRVEGERAGFLETAWGGVGPIVLAWWWHLEPL